MFNCVKKNNCIGAVIICCASLTGCTNQAVETVDGNQVQPASISTTPSTLGSNPVNARFVEPVPTADSSQHGAIELLSPPADRHGIDHSHAGTVVSTLRVWSDNNSQFTTNAELLEISLKARSVKLLKENGIAITVPIDRLSDHDKNFLVHFVAAQTGGFGIFNSIPIESK